VFAEGDKFPERFRCEPLGKKRVGRTVAFKDPVRHQPVWRTFRFDFLRCLAKGQRLGLGEDVRQEDVVMPAERVERSTNGDEVARNEPGALVNELAEGMLAIGSRFAPVEYLVSAQASLARLGMKNGQLLVWRCGRWAHGG
jgi:hypothetical protein